MAAKRQRRRAEKRRRRRRTQRDQGGFSLSAPKAELRLAERVERLTYTRRQAAEALGISLATLDRRIVPALTTVKMPSGMRLIPIRELEQFLEEHREVAAVEFSPRRPAGRRPSVATPVVERIHRERALGKSLGQIARDLSTDGVPTAHGGRRWWPSTVRSVLARATPRT